MNGVMTAGVSAGSNHVGASETCTAHVISPSGAAAADAAAPATATSATASSRERCRAFDSITEATTLTVARPTFGAQRRSVVLDRKDVRIQAGDPVLAVLSHLQVVKSVLQVGADHLPEEGRVGAPKVRGRLVAEPFVRAGFPEFVEQRRGLFQIQDIGKLADQVGGAQ